MDAKVEIGLLHNLTQAESVGAEPVSPDDWEIIVRVLLQSPLPFIDIWR